MKLGTLWAAVATVAMFSCAVTTPHGGADSRVVPAEYVSNGHQATYYYTEGLKQALIHNDSNAARELFLLAIESDSLYAPAYFSLANLYVNGNTPEQGIDYSIKAAAIDTANLEYQSQLGHFYIVTQQYGAALKLYNRLLRQDPHNVNNYRMLAALYEYDRQPFSAIALLDSAEYKFGRIEELANYKRQLLLNVRLYDQAIAETQSMITDFPYKDENYLILAELYGITKKDSLALSNYEQSLRIDSTKLETLASLADFYRARGRNTEYLSTVKRIFAADNIALDTKIMMFGDVTSNLDFYRDNYFQINGLAATLLVKYPSDFSVLQLYGSHLTRSGEIENALTLYKSFIGTHTPIKEPFNLILDIESYLERPDSVAKYSDLALEYFPKSNEIYLRKGYALSNMNNYDEALAAFGEALKYSYTDSMRSVVLGTIGDLYHQMGHEAKGTRTYVKALRLNPRNIPVLNNYSYFASESEHITDKDLEAALGMSLIVCQTEPTNSTYLDTQAWILYKLRRYEEAKKVMLQALSFDSTGSEVLLLHYGDILYALGDDFMAGIYWRRALDRGFDADAIQQRLDKIK